MIMPRAGPRQSDIGYFPRNEGINAHQECYHQAQQDRWSIRWWNGLAEVIVAGRSQHVEEKSIVVWDGHDGGYGAAFGADQERKRQAATESFDIGRNPGGDDAQQRRREYFRGVASFPARDGRKTSDSHRHPRQCRCHQSHCQLTGFTVPGRSVCS